MNQNTNGIQILQNSSIFVLKPNFFIQNLVLDVYQIFARKYFLHGWFIRENKKLDSSFSTLFRNTVLPPPEVAKNDIYVYHT